MEPVIEFKDFSFKYRAQTEPTLRDINLSIMPGEKVLIVGPSGSGKSTLAHCINGLAPFSYPGDMTGTLRVDGKDPAKLGLFGISQIVGTVLQDTDGQFIGLTVAEDLAFSLENNLVPQEEMFVKVDEVAELVDVKKLLDNAPRELSGGQKQRCACVRAMINNPKLLLVDEPTGALDSHSSQMLLSTIQNINVQLRATILMVTHDVFTASYASRILFLKDGEIFMELRKGNDSRNAFFDKILNVLTIIGGGQSHVC